MEYGKIDPKVRELCRVLNAYDGIQTINSCEGHYTQEDIDASTRRSAKGPYVMVSHADPREHDEIARILAGFEDAVQQVNDNTPYHNGVFGAQLYPADDLRYDEMTPVTTADRDDTTSFTVFSPYRETTAPAWLQERYGGYSGAVEVVVDTGAAATRIDERSFPAGVIEQDETEFYHLSSILDFQDIDSSVSPEELEAERDVLLDELVATLEP